MNLRIYYLIVGICAGVVTLASFLLVMLGQNLIIGGWMLPLWLCFGAILVEGCVSFTSFRLATVDNDML